MVCRIDLCGGCGADHPAVEKECRRHGSVFYGGHAAYDCGKCLCYGTDDTVHFQVYDIQSSTVLYGGIFGNTGASEIKRKEIRFVWDIRS